MFDNQYNQNDSNNNEINLNFKPMNMLRQTKREKIQKFSEMKTLQTVNGKVQATKMPFLGQYWDREVDLQHNINENMKHMF
ncbi:unnamed protein product (macronuclear) [Paramecium tetraurelia]|uniref:Uncharacterized protein n=1 Tax=Paramecium tetraurelia TaxID=5888 RepID=A0CLE5_PARTE|nr:uncharacterized protein GSPATT00008160001 [Paramecium tetraurelia]CAK71612.1 unnamed protein product [Paramecium tetraurelia]|eukprot:XP_001439009.1 hypothetical protein (macronuclear) [Paramecium tetraurelia strain d4-2]